MSNDYTIIIKNKKVINLVKKLLKEKYRREGFTYNISKVNIFLEALELLEEKYNERNTR